MSADLDAHLKIAVALRAVRGALGMNQIEFAELVGISKPTIARAETLEAAIRLDSYSSILNTLKSLGVHVETLESDSVRVIFEPDSLEYLRERLASESHRRKDRKRAGIRLPANKP